MSPVAYDQRYYMIPLDVQSQLTSIGKTSFSMRKSFYAKGDLFYENTATIAAVDIKTPFPKQLPDRFEKFKNLIQAKVGKNIKKLSLFIMECWYFFIGILLCLQNLINYVG